MNNHSDNIAMHIRINKNLYLLIHKSQVNNQDDIPIIPVYHHSKKSPL